MNTKELAGKKFYALVARMGGKFRDIHALAVYEFKTNGVPHHVGEAMSCVANRVQYACLAELTEHCGYVVGRPTLARMSAMTEAELLRLTS